MPFPRTSFNPTDLTDQKRNLKTLLQHLQAASQQVQLRLENPDQPADVMATMQELTRFWMDRKADGRY